MHCSITEQACTLVYINHRPSTNSFISNEHHSANIAGLI